MRKRRSVAGILTVVVVASLVATGVAQLRWLLAGDEPAAAEYVELTDRRVHALAFSPDGTKLIVDTDDADQVRWTWDLGARPWEDLDAPPGGSPGNRVVAVAVSLDGTYVAIGTDSDRQSTSGAVRVREQDTGETVWDAVAPWRGPSDGDGAESLAFSPDGSLLAGIVGSETWVWDVATGAVRAKLAGGNGGFSPDGRLLGVAVHDLDPAADGKVQLWDTATSKVRTALTAPYPLSSVVFSPDGRVAATWSRTHVQLWDIATGAVTATMTDGYSLVFSPDGRLLAAKGKYGTVRVWDTATGAEKAILPGHDGPVDALVFSPDGRRLASGGSDGTVRVWDSTSWRETRALEHRERFLFLTTEMAISSIAFSPDGSELAAASNEEEDGRVALWELP